MRYSLYLEYLKFIFELLVFLYLVSKGRQLRYAIQVSSTSNMQKNFPARRFFVDFFYLFVLPYKKQHTDRKNTKKTAPKALLLFFCLIYSPIKIWPITDKSVFKIFVLIWIFCNIQFQYSHILPIWPYDTFIFWNFFPYKLQLALLKIFFITKLLLYAASQSNSLNMASRYSSTRFLY